jgi:glycosyltransferase involved in cell wall biosynthesis
MQKYENYRVIYIDDSSTDKTYDRLKKYLSSRGVSFDTLLFSEDKCLSHEENLNSFCNLVNSSSSKIRIIQNEQRAGALANIYRACQSTQDDEIITMLDGDDSLRHRNVLKGLNRIYKSNNVWLTHGRLVEIPSGNAEWCIPVPDEVVKNNQFRSFSRCPTHLKTFYSWLFKKILLKDLIYDSEFFPMTSDMAIMLPMLEMAGERHYFVKNVNYRYNTLNSLNDNKIDPPLQRFFDAYVRNIAPYERLSEDQIPEFMR